jgi:CBS domain-containing protein
VVRSTRRVAARNSEEIAMLRLRDIMTRDLLTVSPETSVRDAMSLFATNHISGAPVLTNGQLVGVVSMTDLVEAAASNPGVPTQRSGFAEPEDTDDLNVQADDDVNDVPGSYFVEMWDDSGAEAGERMADSDGPEWDSLSEITVGEAMNRQVFSMTSDASVERAAEIMNRRSIHRLLVMDNGRLVGLVSTMDITRAVADQQLTSRTLVFPRAPLSPFHARGLGKGIS